MDLPRLEVRLCYAGLRPALASSWRALARFLSHLSKARLSWPQNPVNRIAGRCPSARVDLNALTGIVINSRQKGYFECLVENQNKHT